MMNGRVLGAGLACIDVIDWRVDRSVSLGGTTANVMTILAQMGFEVKMLTTEYVNDVGKWYSNALDARRISPIYFQTSKKQMPIVLEEINENGKDHFFRTTCPCCRCSLMNVILPSQEKISKVLSDKQQFNVFFFDRFSSGIRMVAEKNNQAWKMYEPNAFRMYSNLLNGCKMADIVKFSSDRIPDNISEKLLNDLRKENTRIIIVSLGKKGLKFTVKNNLDWEEWIYVPSTEKDVIDAAGAGDWLTASFLNQFLKMYPIKRSIDKKIITEMLEQAQIIAQMTCNYKGAQGILRDKDGIKSLSLLTGEEFWKLQDESWRSNFLVCSTCGKIFI